MKNATGIRSRSAQDLPRRRPNPPTAPRFAEPAEHGSMDRPAHPEEEVVMAQSSTAQLFGLGRNDPLFARVRVEAEEAARRDPALASFLMTAILNHDTLEHAVVHRVAERLDHRDAPGAMIRQAYEDAIARDSSIGAAFRADIVAVVDRDPACLRMMEPLLYFKGFHALQTHRLAHALLKSGRRDFALYLQSRASSVFGVDINPAVLIGAGAKILGNIEIGHCARVAAGSVVLAPVPHNKTVAGVPARIVGEAGCAEPARDMNQILAEKALEY